MAGKIKQEKKGNLKMLRCKNKGYTIEITLPTECGYKGYSVECTYIYDKQKEKYKLTMWLKRSDVDNRFKIDSQEIDTQYISGTHDTIKDNICRIVEQALKVGFFDSYIKSFQYIYKCFDIGNDVMENTPKDGEK